MLKTQLVRLFSFNGRLSKKSCFLVCAANLVVFVTAWAIGLSVIHPAAKNATPIDFAITFALMVLTIAVYISLSAAGAKRLRDAGESPFWMSERRDSNPRPLVPQTSALTGLRHAPTGETIGAPPGEGNARAAKLGLIPSLCRALSFG
jgi:uncharacterized membrane protein